MSALTINLSDEHMAALAHVAPGLNAVSYLNDRVQELLTGYVESYRHSRAPITADQGAALFLAASPANQAIVLQALGVQP